MQLLEINFKKEISLSLFVPFYGAMDFYFGINTNNAGSVFFDLSSRDVVLGFLAHLVYQPKSLMQSCFVRRASSASFSVHTSPSHRFKHRNFIFGIHVHICPPNMHIKYLVILTYINGIHFGTFV